MQLSELEQRVLSAIIEGDPEQGIQEAQLSSATVESRDYTGVGLYTKLSVDPESPRLSRPNRYIEQVPKLHLTHPSLSAGAGAMLWLTEGRADTLECYTYEGDWPEDEVGFSVSR